MRRVTRALWREGVTSLLSDDHHQQRRGHRGSGTHHRQGPLAGRIGRCSVAGIHLEGPFISPEDGPRGAHNTAYVRPRTGVCSRGGKRRRRGTSSWSPCRRSGRGPPTSLRSASRRGWRSPSATRRHRRSRSGRRWLPGPGCPRTSATAPTRACPTPELHLGAAGAGRLWATVIADGFHLPESVLKVVLRVKGSRTCW